MKLWVAGILSVLLAACAGSGPAYRFESGPCSAVAQAAGAECGFVRVPENYEKHDGRSLALNIVILRATVPNPDHDVLFELEGGPGIAVSGSVSFYANDGAIYHRNRDIVFVDMRGTGGSGPLHCAGLESYGQSDPSAPLYPTELTGECASLLGQQADLGQYNTTNAVRDIDAVRRALGAEHISLNALSYGTTLALAYMAEHPDRVSAAVLTSAVPASSTPPRYHATAAATALTQLFTACAGDESCSSIFPDPAADLELARQRFATTEKAEVFTERVRTMMYAPAGARRIPLFLRQSAQGISDAKEGTTPSIADGVYLSVTCAESFPHFDVHAARAESRLSVFGDYRLRRQSAACAVWPVAPSSPPHPHRPIQVPVLFVSGSLDPVSPPALTQSILPLFPNGRHVVIQGGGHIVDGLSNLDTCYDPLIVQFLDTRDAVNLDTTCLNDVRPPPFAIE